jgi:glucan biosynthesis protein C
MENVAQQPSRLYYLDWLRVLAMIGIFFFHNARFFDEFSDWHVKNASTSLGASVLVAFLGQWIMPLFFLIAGAGTYYALRSRRIRQFVQERSLRLLVPLIFGMVIIVPPQAYYQAVSHGEVPTNNFLQLYVQYLKTLPELPFYHLWFLAYLFVFSIIALPIFATRTGGGSSIVSKFAQVFSKPWALLPLLILSLSAVDAFLYPGGFWGNRDQGGWNIVAYFLFFFFGYLIFANPRIMESIRKFSWIALGAAIVATAWLLLFFVNEIAHPAATFGTTKFALAHFAQTLNTWCWILAILGLGSRFLNSNNGFLSHANEAVLPFYILHQAVIITIGYYVVQWNVGIGLKYLTISTTSFVAIIAIYEILVRRVNVLRFLFGMRSRSRAPVVLERESAQ